MSAGIKHSILVSLVLLAGFAWLKTVANKNMVALNHADKNLFMEVSMISFTNEGIPILQITADGKVIYRGNVIVEDSDLGEVIRKSNENLREFKRGGKL